MTRDGLMRARDFVALAVRGLVREDQIGVLQRVLAQLQVAVSSYAEPGWAAADRLAGGRGRAAGTGRRRPSPAATPSWPPCRRSPGARLDDDELAEIAGWRDGSAPLAGLTVDTDLSWTLLGALVAHGAAGDAEIDGCRGGRLDRLRRAPRHPGARAAARRPRTRRPSGSG